MSTVDSIKVPRILYVGDVPVEKSYGGSLLLYRLFESYPAERLCILQPSQEQASGLRLDGVTYYERVFPLYRLAQTRLASFFRLYLACFAGARARGIAKIIEGFRPDAVLTVTNGASWLTAARFAEDNSLPLHLVLHDIDDWGLQHHSFPSIRRRAQAVFRRVYVQAASRLCVVPYMEELYRSQCGVSGSVLYPARGSDAPVHVAPPERLRDTNRPLVCGYGGSINSPGYVQALKNMAHALAEIGGALVIYGPMTPESGARAGLTCKNIRWGGMISSREMIQRLREEVDFLFAPMSFAPSDRSNMKASFPSKLADYTAAGLPLIIQGPSYCSAVRWARENPGTAIVIDSEGPENVSQSLNLLRDDPALRWRLAEGALAAGANFFSQEGSLKILSSALTKSEDGFASKL